MAEYPGFTIWTDAYLGDTIHLTTTEHGAYLLLLMTMWRAGGSLPNDPKKLARYAGLTPGQWARISDTVMDFFTEENGTLTQSRLTKELSFVRRKRNAQSENANARWLKDKDKGDAMAMPTRSQVDAPTLTPTLTKKEDTSLRSVAPAAPKPTVKSQLLTVLDEEHAQDVIDHRNKIKKPMTPKAAKMLAAKLGQFKDPNKAADFMIEKGWQSIEREWVANATAEARQSTSKSLRGVSALADRVRRDIENAGQDSSGSADDQVVLRLAFGDRH